MKKRSIEYSEESKEYWYTEESDMKIGEKKFTRHIEDFVCEHCEAPVFGNGYTNHCPKCFWSKHVDVFPGDRLAVCGGLMSPIAVEQESGRYRVQQRCIVCGHERRNLVGSEDDFSALTVLAKVLAEEKNK